MTPLEYANNVMARFGTLNPAILARIECGNLPKAHGNQGAEVKSGRDRTMDGRRRLDAQRLAARDKLYLSAIGQGGACVYDVASAVGVMHRQAAPILLLMHERGLLTRELHKAGTRKWWFYRIK